MKITSITTGQQLHDAYTEDKQTKSVDYLEGVGIVNRKACTKTLVFEREGKMLTTNNWFITHTNNELIYDILANDWINLDMFDKGESYCKEILLIEEDED